MDIKLALPQRQGRRQNNQRQLMGPNGMNANMIPPSSGAKTARNRRRRQARRVRRIAMVGGASADVAPYSGTIQQYIPPSVSLGNSRRIREMNTSLRRVLSSRKLTPDGLAFLKCAFAPPDFAVSNVKGAPDRFEHESYVAKHRLTGTLDNPAGRDTYIWLCPSPGVAYAFVNVASGVPLLGTEQWAAVGYADFVEMFGADEKATANKITQYRYVSNHMELVPTVNQTKWSGGISAFKFQATVNLRQTSLNTTDNIVGLSGLEAANAKNANMFSGPVINGLYTGAYSAAAEFEWQPVYENVKQLPGVFIPGTDFGTLLGVSGHLAGLDNGFENVIIKITNDGTNPNTFITRNYACVQYKVRPGSDSAVMYNAQTVACHDELAITLYKRIIAELPVGVTYMDNDSFWQRVLQIIQMVSGGLSVLPGPYGMAAGGVNMLSNAVEKLVF